MPQFDDMKNIKNKMSLSSMMLIVGLVGVCIGTILNLVALHIYGKTNAVYFSQEWWANWFPGLVSCGSFIVVGIGLKFGRKKEKE